MSVRILHDEENDMAALYSSSTDWAFGPVVSGDRDLEVTASEILEAFLHWLPRDARQYGDSELEHKYYEFRREYDEKRTAELKVEEEELQKFKKEYAKLKKEGKLEAPQTEGETMTEYGADESVSRRLLPHVRGLVKAKKLGDRKAMRLFEKKINRIAGKKVIPRTFTDEEMKNPEKLAKVISCIAKVKAKQPSACVKKEPGERVGGKTCYSPFAVCRGQIMGAPQLYGHDPTESDEEPDYDFWQDMKCPKCSETWQRPYAIIDEAQEFFSDKQDNCPECGTAGVVVKDHGWKRENFSAEKSVGNPLGFIVERCVVKYEAPPSTGWVPVKRGEGKKLSEERYNGGRNVYASVWHAMRDDPDSSSGFAKNMVWYWLVMAKGSDWDAGNATTKEGAKRMAVASVKSALGSRD